MQALQPVTRYSTCHPAGKACKTSKAAPDRISLDSQMVNQAKECLRLTKEQEIIRKSLDRGHCSSVLCRRWSNHGALRQTLADEFTWLRQDQIGLVEL